MDPEEVDLWTWTCRYCSGLSSARNAGGWSLLTEDFLEMAGEGGSLITLSTRVPDTGSGSSSSSSESVSVTWIALPLTPLLCTLESSMSLMVWSYWPRVLGTDATQKAETWQIKLELGQHIRIVERAAGHCLGLHRSVIDHLCHTAGEKVLLK